MGEAPSQSRKIRKESFIQETNGDSTKNILQATLYLCRYLMAHLDMAWKPSVNWRIGSKFESICFFIKRMKLSFKSNSIDPTNFYCYFFHNKLLIMMEKIKV